MNNKHRVLIYRDRWRGWSIYCNDHLYVLGFIDWADELQSICQNCAIKYSFGIGIEGWEL